MRGAQSSVTKSGSHAAKRATYLRLVSGGLGAGSVTGFAILVVPATHRADSFSVGLFLDNTVLNMRTGVCAIFGSFNRTLSSCSYQSFASAVRSRDTSGE